MSNFDGLVYIAEFGQFFRNNLGLGAYFSKPIFALKPWIEPVNLNTMNPIIVMIFFHL